jgi:hypothetical protein
MGWSLATMFKVIMTALAVTLIIAIAWFFNMLFDFMGDYRRNEGIFDRAWGVWVTCYFGGLLIGTIIPRFWYLSILLAFPEILFISSAIEYANRADNLQFWLIAINTNFVSPLIALSSAYLASQLRRTLEMSKSAELRKRKFIIISLLALFPIFFVLIWFRGINFI